MEDKINEVVKPEVVDEAYNVALAQKIGEMNTNVAVNIGMALDDYKEAKAQQEMEERISLAKSVAKMSTNMAVDITQSVINNKGSRQQTQSMTPISDKYKGAVNYLDSLGNPNSPETRELASAIVLRENKETAKLVNAPQYDVPRNKTAFGKDSIFSDSIFAQESTAHAQINQWIHGSEAKSDFNYEVPKVPNTIRDIVGSIFPSDADDYTNIKGTEDLGYKASKALFEVMRKGLESAGMSFDDPIKPTEIDALKADANRYIDNFYDAMKNHGDKIGLEVLNAATSFLANGGFVDIMAANPMTGIPGKAYLWTRKLFDTDIKYMPKILTDLNTAVTNMKDESYKTNVPNYTDSQTISTMTSLAMQVPGMAASFATKNPTYALAAMYALVFGKSMTDIEKEHPDMTYDTRRKLAHWNAVSEVATEIIPAHSLTKAVSGNKIIRSMGWFIGSDAVGEPINELSGMVGEAQATGIISNEPLLPIITNVLINTGIQELVLGGAGVTTGIYRTKKQVDDFNKMAYVHNTILYSLNERGITDSDGNKLSTIGYKSLANELFPALSNKLGEDRGSFSNKKLSQKTRSFLLLQDVKKLEEVVAGYDAGVEEGMIKKAKNEFFFNKPTEELIGNPYNKEMSNVSNNTWNVQLRNEEGKWSTPKEVDIIAEIGDSFLIEFDKKIDTVSKNSLAFVGESTKPVEGYFSSFTLSSMKENPDTLHILTSKSNVKDKNTFVLNLGDVTDETYSSNVYTIKEQINGVKDAVLKHSKTIPNKTIAPKATSYDYFKSSLLKNNEARYMMQGVDVGDIVKFDKGDMSESIFAKVKSVSEENYVWGGKGYVKDTTGKSKYKNVVFEYVQQTSDTPYYDIAIPPTIASQIAEKAPLTYKVLLRELIDLKKFYNNMKSEELKQGEYIYKKTPPDIEKVATVIDTSLGQKTNVEKVEYSTDTKTKINSVIGRTKQGVTLYDTDLGILDREGNEYKAIYKHTNKPNFVALSSNSDILTAGETIEEVEESLRTVGIKPNTVNIESLDNVIKEEVKDSKELGYSETMNIVDKALKKFKDLKDLHNYKDIIKDIRAYTTTKFNKSEKVRALSLSAYNVLLIKEGAVDDEFAAHELIHLFNNMAFLGDKEFTKKVSDFANRVRESFSILNIDNLEEKTKYWEVIPYVLTNSALSSIAKNTNIVQEATVYDEALALFKEGLVIADKYRSGIKSQRYQKIHVPVNLFSRPKFHGQYTFDMNFLDAIRNGLKTSVIVPTNEYVDVRIGDTIDLIGPSDKTITVKVIGKDVDIRNLLAYEYIYDKLEITNKKLAEDIRRTEGLTDFIKYTGKPTAAKIELRKELLYKVRDIINKGIVHEGIEVTKTSTGYSAVGKDVKGRDKTYKFTNFEVTPDKTTDLSVAKEEIEKILIEEGFYPDPKDTEYGKGWFIENSSIDNMFKPGNPYAFWQNKNATRLVFEVQGEKTITMNKEKSTIETKTSKMGREEIKENTWERGFKETTTPNIEAMKELFGEDFEYTDSKAIEAIEAEIARMTFIDFVLNLGGDFSAYGESQKGTDSFNSMVATGQGLPASVGTKGTFRKTIEIIKGSELLGDTFTKTMPTTKGYFETILVHPDIKTLYDFHKTCVRKQLELYIASNGEMGLNPNGNAAISHFFNYPDLFLEFGKGTDYATKLEEINDILIQRTLSRTNDLDMFVSTTGEGELSTTDRNIVSRTIREQADSTETNKQFIDDMIELGAMADDVVSKEDLNDLNNIVKEPLTEYNDDISISETKTETKKVYHGTNQAGLDSILSSGIFNKKKGITRNTTEIFNDAKKYAKDKSIKGDNKFYVLEIEDSDIDEVPVSKITVLSFYKEGNEKTITRPGNKLTDETGVMPQMLVNISAKIADWLRKIANKNNGHTSKITPEVQKMINTIDRLKLNVPQLMADAARFDVPLREYLENMFVNQGYPRTTTDGSMSALGLVNIFMEYVYDDKTRAFVETEVEDYLVNYAKKRTQEYSIAQRIKDNIKRAKDRRLERLSRKWEGTYTFFKSLQFFPDVPERFRIAIDKLLGDIKDLQMRSGKIRDTIWLNIDNEEHRNLITDMMVLEDELKRSRKSYYKKSEPYREAKESLKEMLLEEGLNKKEIEMMMRNKNFIPAVANKILGLKWIEGKPVYSRISIIDQPDGSQILQHSDGYSIVKPLLIEYNKFDEGVLQLKQEIEDKLTNIRKYNKAFFEGTFVVENKDIGAEGRGYDQILAEFNAKVLEFNKLPIGVKKNLLRVRNAWRSWTAHLLTELKELGMIDEKAGWLDYVPYYIDKSWDQKRWMGLPKKVKEQPKFYTHKAHGTKRARYMTPELLVDHILNVKYDIIINRHILDIANQFDKSRELSDSDREKLYRYDDESNLNQYARAGQVFSGDLGDGVKEYVFWTPEFFKINIGYAQDGESIVLNNSRSFLLEKHIVDALNSLSLPYNIIMDGINKIVSIWKRTIIATIFPAFNFNNMLGDMQMFITIHPNGLKALGYLPKTIEFLIKYAKYLKGTDVAFNPLEEKVKAFIEEYNIIEAGEMRADLSTIDTTKILKWTATKMSNVAMWREAILRCTNAYYIMDEVENNNTENVRKSFQFLNIDTTLSDMDYLGRVSKEIMIDYFRRSPNYQRYITNFAMPWGHFYIKGSLLWNKWMFAGDTLIKRAGGFLKKATILMIPPALANVWNYGLIGGDEDKRKERYAIEQSLPIEVRNRFHLIIGVYGDKKVVWTPQYLPDILIGTKFASIFQNKLFMLRAGEISAKQVVKDLLHDWSIAEGKSALFLLNPMVRFVGGFIDGKDPLDGSPIWSAFNTNNLTWKEMAGDLAIYFNKVLNPLLSTYVASYHKKGYDHADSFWEAVKRFGYYKDILGVREIDIKPQVLKQTGRWNDNLDQPGERDITQQLYKDVYDKISLESSYIRDITSSFTRSKMGIDEYIKSDEVKKIVNKMVDKVYNGTMTQEQYASFTKRFFNVFKDPENLIRWAENNKKEFKEGTEGYEYYSDLAYQLRLYIKQKGKGVPVTIRSEFPELMEDIIE